MGRFIARHSHVIDDFTVATLEIENRKIVLTVVEKGITAKHEFTYTEWLKFIVGSVDIENFMHEAGVGFLTGRD